jgi:hypothetical protein
MKTQHLISLTCLLLLWAACREAEPMVGDLPPYINPPVPALDPASEVRSIDAEAGAILRYESGSEVIIPPASLVDGAGQPITGSVDIAYREFHHAAEILLSGIPMAYDTAGATRQFETAGMFELRASQNGQPLFVGQGNLVQVRMASNTAEDNYNFYRLDEEARNWQFEGQRSPEANVTRENIKARIAELESRPGEIRRLGEDPFAFNYSGLLDVFFKEDETRIYAAMGKEGVRPMVLAKARAYGLKCMEFSVYQRIDFQGKSYPACMMVWDKLSEKPFPSWAKSSWNHKLKKFDENLYQLILRDGESNYQMCWVRPVMPLRQLFAKDPAGWEEKSQALLAEIEREVDRMKKEAEVMRTFEIREFGVYNWDRLKREENSIPLFAEFEMGLEESEESAKPTVFLLPGDNRSVVKLPEQQWEQFYLTDDPDARLLSILPGPRIALFSKQKYRAIDRDALRAQEEKPRYTFAMEDIGALESQQQLMSILGM